MRNYPIVILSFIVGLLFTHACTPSQPSTPPDTKISPQNTATLTGLIKLDEFSLQHEGEKARIRLIGVFGFDQSAKDPILQAINGPIIAAAGAYFKKKKVVLNLHEQKKDDFGRMLGTAEHQGLDMRHKIIKEGWGVVYTEYPDKSLDVLFKLEAEAQKARRGLWADDHLQKIIVGLRRQWKDARIAAARGDVLDPLLAQAAESSAASKVSDAD